jgi:competence ComEA-like helix-hairpin-helix protein
MLGLREYIRPFALYIFVLFCFLAIGCATPHEAGISRSNMVIDPNAININTAGVKDLESLPGIGETLAERIVEFRETNGRFSKPEHLLLVQGISESKFRRIRPLIRVE